MLRSTRCNRVSSLTASILPHEPMLTSGGYSRVAPALRLEAAEPKSPGGKDEKDTRKYVDPVHGGSPARADGPELNSKEGRDHRRHRGGSCRCGHWKQPRP